MKTIVKYMAEDGTEFDTDYDCLNYESPSNEIVRLAKQLLVPRHPTWDGPAKLNYDEKSIGGSMAYGYIQQNAENCFKFRKRLAQLSFAHTKLKEFKEPWLKPPEWFLFGSTCLVRLTEELGKGSPLWSHGWFRIGCIDQKFREYEQGYFAMNPEDAEKKRGHQVG